MSDLFEEMKKITALHCEIMGYTKSAAHGNTLPSGNGSTVRASADQAAREQAEVMLGTERHTGPLICEHGSLRRQCSVCDDAETIAELMQFAELVQDRAAELLVACDKEETVKRIATELYDLSSKLL